MGSGISIANLAVYDETEQRLVIKERIGIRCDNDPCQPIFDCMKDASIYQKIYETWKKEQDKNKLR